MLGGVGLEEADFGAGGEDGALELFADKWELRPLKALGSVYADESRIGVHDLEGFVYQDRIDESVEDGGQRTHGRGGIAANVKWH
jgi:hypothetical protein